MFRRCCAAPSQMWSAPPTACRRYAAAPVAALRALMKSYMKLPDGKNVPDIFAEMKGQPSKQHISDFAEPLGGLFVGYMI